MIAVFLTFFLVAGLFWVKKATFWTKLGTLLAYRIRTAIGLPDLVPCRLTKFAAGLHTPF